MCTGYNTARKPNSAGYEKTFATGPPRRPRGGEKDEEEEVTQRVPRRQRGGPPRGVTV